jgi:hypothetical protein
VSERALSPRDVQDPVVSTADGQGGNSDIDRRYVTLHAVLMEAFAQASQGKGADRHGSALPYEQQITAAIARESGPAGPWFQSAKKITEAMRMNGRGMRAQARAEALGACVYAALGVIALDETPP